MNVKSATLGGSAQEFQIGEPVVVIEEADLAIIAALGNVLRDTDEV
jgi:hypothetical protein